MKKKLGILVTMMGTIALLAGCGKADTDKYVTVPEYKGIAAEVEAVNVTQDEIDAYITEQLEGAAVPTPVTDREVKNGDTVKIDFVGKKDGVAFEGGTSPEGGSDLTIGSGQFIPGFEEGLVGTKIGEKIDIDLTFPEDYQDETLKGQAVVFSVTVNAITESIVPELTDAIVPTLAADCKNVEEYKKYVSETLTKEETENYHTLIANQVFEKVYAEATVSNPPKELVEKYRKKGDEMAQSYADAYQVSVEEFVTSVLGSTMEEFNAQTDTMAQEMTKEYLVVHSIANKEGLKVSDKEIKEFAQEGLAESGLASVDEYIEKVGKEEIEVFLLSQKVMDALEGYAVVTEK